MIFKSLNWNKENKKAFLLARKKVLIRHNILKIWRLLINFKSLIIEKHYKVNLAQDYSLMITMFFSKLIKYLVKKL